MNEKSRMRAASLCKALFERPDFALGDLPLDLLREPFTLAARTKISLHILVRGRFFHLLKPACELPPFLLWQMLDRFFDGFERDTVNLAYAKHIVIL